IAAALAVCGVAAIIWSSQSFPMTQEQISATNLARSLGIVTLVIGSLMTLNYLYAFALVRKMLRGDGVVERWTVAPATIERFRDAERARKRRKNNWRIPRRSWPKGLPVVFSANAVLVGDTYFRLVGRGTSRFTFARIDNDGVPYVEFSMTVTVIGAGPQSRTARYRGHLRIPMADAAGVEAARVVSYFQKLVSLA
ncbi:MAG: hypothetical protein ABIW83_05585, partial [Allosphingosinicella sp.]